MLGLLIFLIVLLIGFMVYRYKNTPTWRRIINMMTVVDDKTKLVQTWYVDAGTNDQPFYLQLQNFTGASGGDVTLARYNVDGSYAFGGVSSWAGLPDGSLRIGDSRITLTGRDLFYTNNYVQTGAWSGKLTAATMPMPPAPAQK